MKSRVCSLYVISAILTGSEKFDSMTKLYYRDALAAILCFDIVDITSLDRAKYWAAQLRENAPGCKIYLCATKVIYYSF